LENFVLTEGLVDEVVFGGLQEDMDSIYQMADVFVLSSLWEGCPNVLLEAMANKLPIVATKVGGVEEIVLHMENGYLVKPKSSLELTEALRFIFKNQSRRLEFAQKGFLRAKDDFSLEKNISKLESIFICAAS
jgi:glycosyltransferase involved in cell wall biosynthesis